MVLVARLFILSLFFFACSPAKEDPVPEKRLPVVIAPGAGPKPFQKRIQLNSGSSFGTTTNGYGTSISVANTATEQSGTTTNGYRIKYNVQDPNAAR